MNSKQKIVVIVGPTAVGKTALSVDLARKFQGEIISGDALQVYQQLDIGTAKATDEERKGVPHFLIDEVPLDGKYSVSDFQQSARKHIDDITKRGHLPIIVGGTGLYIQALLFDFNLGGNEDTLSETKKQQFRDKWEETVASNGQQFAWDYLNKCDAKAAATIHPNNVKRVIRAIELRELLGKSILDQQIDFTDLSQSLYEVKLIGLSTDRQLLYDRINLRVDQMLHQGLLEEVKLLAKMPDVQGAQGIGYKEFFPYLKGNQTLEEAVEQVKQNSRRYAKRQLTWFRNRMSVDWWDLVKTPEKQPLLEMELSQWLNSKRSN